MKAILGVFFEALFRTLLAGWEESQARQALATASRRAGAAEASAETQTVIAEAADARSALPAPAGSPGDLARRLRERAARPADGERADNVVELFRSQG